MANQEVHLLSLCFPSPLEVKSTRLRGPHECHGGAAVLGLSEPDFDELLLLDCFFDSSFDSSSWILSHLNSLDSIDSSLDPAAPTGKSDLLTDNGGGVLSDQIDQ
jgi:hypothetical protein